jgi:hypothetical protein
METAPSIVAVGERDRAHGVVAVVGDEHAPAFDPHAGRVEEARVGGGAVGEAADAGGTGDGGGVAGGVDARDAMVAERRQ